MVFSTVPIHTDFPAKTIDLISSKCFCANTFLTVFASGSQICAVPLIDPAHTIFAMLAKERGPSDSKIAPARRKRACASCLQQN